MLKSPLHRIATGGNTLLGYEVLNRPELFWSQAAEPDALTQYCPWVVRDFSDNPRILDSSARRFLKCADSDCFILHGAFSLFRISTWIRHTW